MADENKTPDENSEERPEDRPEDRLDTPDDSGLGNLPPLSDFDSGGMDSDGGLPPLGNFDSGGSPSDSAGLPPISDIQVETPQPTGGNVKRPPEGFDSQVSDTFSSGTPGIDTPAGTTPSEGVSPSGSGFQDLAADSDFSPETPEIGPGPDSNMDTPMFDSAFGGGGSGSGFGGGDTGAPTQAMETPMFGQQGGQQDQQRGFDAGAFGGGGSPGDFNMGGGGTPAPDFSPDTGMGGQGGQGGMPPAAASPSEGGRGGSPLVLVLAAVIALIIGIAAGPFASTMLPFLPNPAQDELEAQTAQVQQLQSDVSRLNNRLQEYENLGVEPGDRQDITPEALEGLRSDILSARDELQQVSSELQGKSEELNQVTRDHEEITEEYVARRDEFEDLQNELAITQAQQRGLVIEVDRLTNQVGELEEADARRAATKNALELAVDRLYIRVKEGLPLTPSKYDRSERIQRVEELREQLDGSKWVTPALQNAFNELYLDELAISQSQEYFYSKVPVVDSYGSRVLKWAECIMQGNHQVVYRTFDGKNIGVFKNTGTGADPVWGFDENFPPAARKELEARVINNRVEGYEKKIQALAERQLSLEPETGFQRVFGSL